MAVSRKVEARALAADELDLVERSHHPAVQSIPDRDLGDLVKLVRERRAKARTEAHRRRREMRGKSDPKGASRSKADQGSHLKLEVLATALRRLNAEAQRRRAMAASAALVANARKALRLKEEAQPDDPAPNSRTARDGMRNIASRRRQNLKRPMEAGRLRKANAVAQAKKDAR
jgi:hypothetical protein